MIHTPECPLGHMLRIVSGWAPCSYLSCLIHDQGHCCCQLCSNSVSGGPAKGWEVSPQTQSYLRGCLSQMALIIWK